MVWHVLKDALNSCKLAIAFKCQKRLSKYFCYKGPIPKDLISDVVYKFQCGLCNKSNYNQSIRHLDIRSGKHIGMLLYTEKKIKPSNNSAVCDHLFHCKVLSSFDNFNILAHKANNYLLKIKENERNHSKIETLIPTSFSLFDCSLLVHFKYYYKNVRNKRFMRNMI